MNTTHNVIPALQSMIARNRNDLSSLNRLIEKDTKLTKVFGDTPYSHENRVIKFKEMQVLVSHQKVLKKLLAREYAEERIREFNRQCQLMRNK